MCDMIMDRKQPCCKVVSLPNFKRREVVQMDVYEVLNLLFSGGTFLIALLAYIEWNHKRKYIKGVTGAFYVY